jgi:hypothetical protein
MASKKDAATKTEQTIEQTATSAPVESSPTDLMALGSIQGVAERPKSIDPNDMYGTEGISADELRLPRMLIAQAQSPQMTEGNSAFIEGLKNYDLFNDLTNEIYGRGPITFVACRRDVRIIEFVPREEGGGIVDMEVPRNDPRTKWTKDEDGNKIPPVATEFVECVALLLRPGKMPEPIVISIKTTNKWNRKAADQLTTFIKMRNAPIYSGLYTVASTPEKNDQGQFGVWVIRNGGFIPKDTPAGKALYDHAEKFTKSLEGKNVIINREGDDADEFDPETLERESQAAAGRGM